MLSYVCMFVKLNSLLLCIYIGKNYVDWVIPWALVLFLFTVVDVYASRLNLNSFIAELNAKIESEIKNDRL